jgi:thiamine biosynthesis lipoprotein
MVLGADEGARLARRLGLDALFLLRDGLSEIRAVGAGSLFSEHAPANASASGS